jgi:hypothetical protein
VHSRSKLVCGFDAHPMGTKSNIYSATAVVVGHTNGSEGPGAAWAWSKTTQLSGATSLHTRWGRSLDLRAGSAPGDPAAPCEKRLSA